MGRCIRYVRGNKKLSRLFVCVLIGFLCENNVTLHAQTMDASVQEVLPDTVSATSLLEAFQKGKTDFRFRYYFMSTINNDILTDYFATAAGGSIKFESAPFHRLRFGVGGFFTFNVWSSDLSKPDPYTNAGNRYETGLFNIQDPSTKKNLANLEYLYLKFNLNNGSVTAGKQLLNTPFINPQDGRMRPTMEDAVYGTLRTSKIIWEGGWLYNIAPRSTVKWFTVANSLGVYPAGFNRDGTLSGYPGNISSKGIGLFGATYAISKEWKLKFWEQYTENVFNVWMLQAEWKNMSNEDRQLFSALRLIGENAVNDGGNNDPNKAYFPKGTASVVISTSVALESKHWKTSLNYTRITKQGRFLSPREWGAEPLYTFMYRERNEGAGDVHAVNWKMKNKSFSQKLVTEIAVGYFNMPDVKNYRLNKYGMPSYAQLNLDSKYSFGKPLKNLEAEFLFVYKKRLGEIYDNSKYVINKVSLYHFSLMLNYKFSP